MADLTQEQYDQLPDFAKDSFQQSGDVYVTVKDAKLRETLNDLDGKYKSSEAKLREAADNQAAAIEQAKKEALEAAKTSGDVAEVEKKFTEMMADLETRKNSEMDLLRGENEALSSANKNSKRKSILSDLRGKLGVFEESHKHFDALVGSQIDVDAKTGAITYLGEDGSATSLDDAGFLATLRDDPAFSRMRQAQPTGSGGIVSGSNKIPVAVPQHTQAAEAAKAKGDLNGFLNASLNKSK